MKKRLLSPFQKFVQIESLSGILLFAATIVAMVWANSPFGESYTNLWQYNIGISTKSIELDKPLILWVNDGLMAVFFFLIGLEIKREFLIGELNSVKKIAFPLFGALGGMLMPVALFMLLNKNPETFNAWGVPMATDIAFSLAVLKLLGDRVPLSLKVFLTAFAIVDDIGAVLVIAIFYSGSIDTALLAYAFILLAISYALSYKGIFSKYLNLAFGAIIWILFLKAGIHPTLAGILLAFSVPVRQKVDTTEFIENLIGFADKFRVSKIVEKPILSKEQIEQIDDLEDWINKYQSPLQHLEHKLHDWVAYLIIPIFALANAGVVINSDMTLDYDLIKNITICLVFGNFIGISSIILTAKKIKLIEVPQDISNWQIVGVSFLAGIGFTMAIFVASLAFSESPKYIDSAKIGILIGSFLSAIIGYCILRFKTQSQNALYEN